MSQNVSIAKSGLKLATIESTTPLSGGASYTSDWLDVSGYETLIFACKADVAGTLYAQFSNVGTEAAGDATPSQLTYNVAANTNEVHRLLRTRQYFRLRYTNGASAQSSFHIQCFAGAGAELTSVVGGTIQQDQDAVVTRLIPTAIEVSQGLFTGYTSLNKFGRNPQIDTTTDPEDVISYGGTYAGHPTGSAETVEVFSSDATDDSGNTGATTIRIYGLDANMALQQEDLTMDGTNAVTSSNTYKRVFRGEVLTAGSNGSNAGTITCRHTTTTANIFFVIAIGKNQTEIAVYTVPASKTLYITSLYTRMTRVSGAAGSAHCTLRVRESGGVYRAIQSYDITDSQPYVFEANLSCLVIPAQSDIKIMCESVSDNATIVDAGFTGVLVDS